ncbi:MAG: MATE family efflux transporter [Fimbriimonadaceae bacterium]
MSDNEATPEESPEPRPDAIAENPLKVIWKLAWPAVTLNFLQTINSLLDTNFIQHIGRNALTAIGSSTTTLFLLVSMSMALGVAATAIVSRAFGAGDMDEVKEGNRKCLGFAVVAGFLLAFVAPLLAPIAATAFVPKDAPAARDLMIHYLQIVGLFLPAVFVIQTLAGSLRGIGDTKSPMVISGAQIILHIILNFLLIFPTRTVHPFGLTMTLPGANLGLNGAAWALVISGWIAALVYLFYCIRTPLGKVYNIKLPGLDWSTRIGRLAGPAALMSFTRVTSMMMFTYILTQVPNGDVAIGALRPGFSVESLAFMPSFGLAIAASALVGQSLGARNPDRASKLGWIAAHQAGIVSLVMAVVIYVFAPQITNALMGEQPAYAAECALFLKHIAVTEVFFGYNMVLVGAQQGAGDTRSPFWLTLITMWGIRVPLAAFLALSSVNLYFITFEHGLNMGSRGCWMAMAITQAIAGIGSMYLWKRGAWKTARA